MCDLIEGMRPPGVFAVLDDVSKSVHSQSEGADKALQQRLPSCQNPHFDIRLCSLLLFFPPLFVDALQYMRGNAFCVKHYAGDVTYEVTGMVEKNKDTLLRDHLQVFFVSFSLSLFSPSSFRSSFSSIPFVSIN